MFPHPKLTIEAVLIEEEEVRVPRRRRRFRRPDYRVQDRRLLSIVSTHPLRTAADLVALLPSDLPSPFTSDVLAVRLGQVPLWFARRVAYTLRHCGSARMTGKVGNRLIYELVPTHQPESGMMVAC